MSKCERESQDLCVSKLHGKDVKSRGCRRLVKKRQETDVNDQKGSEALSGSRNVLIQKPTFRPRHSTFERKAWPCMILGDSSS
jgi:hypothetical protein